MTHIHAFKPAVYHPQTIRRYRGNPFIEALPLPKGEADLVAAMLRLPDMLPEDKALSSFERQHLIHAIPNSFMQPLTDHVTLAIEVSAMIRAGYLTRNPLSPRFLALVGKAVMTDFDESLLPSQASGYGMAVIGMSGTGKSTAIEAVLRTYPSVIYHPDLSGSLRATLQVTYAKISCPIDASPITVCRSFFTYMDDKLGTNYHHLFCGGRATLESMRDAMKRLCFIHGVGVFVVDEIQNLSKAKSGGAQALLKFFLTLRDVLKVPVIAVGTEDATPVLADSMQLARRHAGRPLFARMADDAEFDLFCDALLSAYYLREPLRDDRTFRKALYHLSQGIADIAIKLVTLAQVRALLGERETIDIPTLQVEYNESLHLLHEHLDVIRAGGHIHGPAYEYALCATGGNITKPPKMPTWNPVKVDTKTKRGTNPKAPDPPKARLHQVPREAALLPKIVQGRPSGISAYDALKGAGHIRDIGTEVITAE